MTLSHLKTPTAEHPAIRFDEISKTFPPRGGQGAVAALEGISLNVASGRIVGVIGRSGAGKSTLIRLLNGLETVTNGTLSLFGRNVTRLTEAEWRVERRQIGMVFQHFNLLSSRTVFDNIALPLEIAGTPKGEIARRVGDLLELVGLTDKSARYPVELSGGQKQRVGIARALATEPRILLCDEATSALDPETTRSILALLREINRRLGVTILLITHEIAVIRDIADEVAVLEGGRIVEHGSSFDVLTTPKAEITRRLVEGVITVETPATIAAALRPSPASGGLAVLRVGFSGEHATSPVLSRLSSTLGLDVNILAGRIDTIGDQPFGSLIIAVPGQQPDEAAVHAALRRLGFTVEALGYLTSVPNAASLTLPEVARVA